MCFGGPKMKTPKAAPVVTPAITPPIEEELPTTQSGADLQNKKKQQQKPTNTSLFQVDLTIPSVGASAGQGSTGASVR